MSSVNLGVNVDHKIVIAGALVVGVAALYVRHKTLNFVADNAEKLDPTNPQNLIYQTVNKGVSGITGDKNDTVGSVIHDKVAGQNGGSTAARILGYLPTPIKPLLILAGNGIFPK